MVKLKLRHLKIEVKTDAGNFGVDLALPSGLVVIRAENSSGKSTLIQSIIFALGLEGMLSASRNIPLPHAITHTIDDEQGVQHSVNASSVSLEFENHLGTVATCVRKVKGTMNHNLITLIHGPALSAPFVENSYLIEDKYVRDPGAAVSSTGFHAWLAEFLGWDLPLVTQFDGKQCLLYLECMFPLMLVEQKKAWTGIQARMPTHFRIRDVARRATEFILNLSVFDQASKRQQLRMERERLLREWQKNCTDLSMAARAAGGVIQGLDSTPLSKWEDGGDVGLMLRRENKWIKLSEAKEMDESQIEDLVSKEIPSVSAVSDELTRQLRAAEEALSRIQVSIAELVQQTLAKRSQLSNLNNRLNELEDDLNGNKAIRKIRNMGSANAPKSVTERKCPTCHQQLDDSLLGQNAVNEIMSLDDNIEFIETQRKIYRSSKDNIARSLAVTDAELSAFRNEENDLRGRIRSIKSTLVSEGQSPSKAAIELLISAQARLARTIEAETQIEGSFDALKEICPLWAQVTKELKLLPEDYLSNSDRDKIDELERLFKQHAEYFDVRSIPPARINISKETYKPEFEGFDLEFDLSASDLIRTIWAYLHSLLELARTKSTNHLGLLVLDEPRQQETKRESFMKFFKRAEDAEKFNQQVIVTTSESHDELKRILNDVSHTFIEFKGDHILKLLESEPLPTPS